MKLFILYEKWKEIEQFSHYYYSIALLLIFLTCCNHFLKFLMRFEQVFFRISSILQWFNGFNSWRFFGNWQFIWTFNSCHRFSIRFKSGLIEDHSKTTVIFFFWSNTVTGLDICLGWLSFWKVNHQLRSRFCADSCRFSSRILI